jgi:hypothetical protein
MRVQSNRPFYYQVHSFITNDPITNHYMMILVPGYK